MVNKECIYLLSKQFDLVKQIINTALNYQALLKRDDLWRKSLSSAVCLIIVNFHFEVQLL